MSIDPKLALAESQFYSSFPAHREHIEELHAQYQFYSHNTVDY